MTVHGSAASEYDPQKRLQAELKKSQDELRKHLRTHLDADYAEWVADELIDFCRTVRSDRGNPKLMFAHLFDDVALKQIPDDRRWLTATLMHPPYQKRGRPRDWYGPSLIRWVNDYYPPWVGRKSRRDGATRSNAYFEDTCRIVFELSGLLKLSDMTDKVCDALKDVVNPTDGAKLVQSIWRARR